MVGENEMIEFIRGYIDFGYFARHFLNLEVKDFHLEWIDLIRKYRKVAILAPTGFGKTTILGIAYTLWLVTYEKRREIMIVSNTLAQSTRILERIKKTIEENPKLNFLMPSNYRETWTKSEINTSTNCKIFVRPYTLSIRGLHLDYIICDEAATFKDVDIFFRYILTRIVAKRGRIACISTPVSPVDLMMQLKDPKHGFYFKVYPAIVDGKSIWEEKFPLEYLEQIRKEIGEERFEREYMCNPKVSEDAIFALGDIIECFDTGLSLQSRNTDGLNFLGCDFAMSGGTRADYDAYVVIRKFGDKNIILWLETEKGMSIESKVEKIKDFYFRYKPYKILLDESFVGKAVGERLLQEGIGVEFIDFHSKNRKFMLDNLREIISSKRLVIPRNLEDSYTITMTDKLINQLASFKEEKSEKTGIVTYQAKGHDDLVMALALACKGSEEQRTYEALIISG